MGDGNHMSKVTTRRRKGKAHDTNINCHFCKRQKWGINISRLEVNQHIGQVRCRATVGQTSRVHHDIRLRLKNTSIDSKFREAQVVSVIDSIMEGCLGVKATDGSCRSKCIPCLSITEPTTTDNGCGSYEGAEFDRICKMCHNIINLMEGCLGVKLMAVAEASVYHVCQ